MLSELIVHNFAIIRHLEVSFEQGLNIVTGETGAGKSILVGAVNLILGSRASQEMIRTGADEASVEAFFSLPDRRFAAGKLEEWGIDSTGDLIIRRTIARGGKSRVFINGRMAALQQLQQLARGLISVSGQHEHQMLLNADVHLGLLDTFGRLELERADVGEAYSRWAQTLDSLRKVRKLKQERASQLDWMRFQLNELETARLQPDEDVCLQQEINILKHAAILMDSATNAYQTLYAARGSVLEKLADVEKNLQSLSGIDPAQEHFWQHLEQGRIHLEELAHGLQQYTQHISSDPRDFPWSKNAWHSFNASGKIRRQRRSHAATAGRTTRGAHPRRGCGFHRGQTGKGTGPASRPIPCSGQQLFPGTGTKLHCA